MLKVLKRRPVKSNLLTAHFKKCFYELKKRRFLPKKGTKLEASFDFWKRSKHIQKYAMHSIKKDKGHFAFSEL